MFSEIKNSPAFRQIRNKSHLHNCFLVSLSWPDILPLAIKERKVWQMDTKKIPAQTARLFILKERTILIVF